MTEAVTSHRLEGLEPDNLLAFLALLGLLRSLEAFDRKRQGNEKFRCRASWDLKSLPIRPVLHVAYPTRAEDLAEAAANGLARIADDHDLGDWKRENLNYDYPEARRMLVEIAHAASVSARGRVDLVASLMSDAAVKENKGSNPPPLDPTPLCLLFGQGHQHFLERLVAIPATPAPPPRGRGHVAVQLSAAECLMEALFAPWHREDPTFSFRWDPEEDVRYASMAGNPTDVAYKGGTQHGANRLAAVGLAAITMAPETRAGRVRPSVLGGEFGTGGFSFSWPLWREPATLAGIRSLLGNPNLSKPHGLAYLGIDQVLRTKRISVGKFMNFTRARPRFVNDED